MRIVPLAILFATIAFAQAPSNPPAVTGNEAPKKARVEGSVTSISGQPIARATVRLTSLAVVGVIVPTATTTTTNDAGLFVFEQVEPSPNYQLSAERPGFVTARYGTRTPTAPPVSLNIAAGQEVKGLSIVMTPQGVISGRVTDESGDFIQGAQVRAMRRGFQRGVRTMVQVGVAATNDVGEYRLANLPPGRIYIVVSSRNVVNLNPVQEQQPAQEANLTTYYPNAAEEQNAAPINVAAGADVRGIDIRLRRGRVYSISGKAIDAASGAPARVALAALPKTNGDANPAATLLIGTSQSGTDGSFILRGLAPGPYVVQTLQVRLNGNALGGGLTGRVEITIADEDVKNLTVPLTAGATIQGTVKLEDGDIKQMLGTTQNPAAGAASAQLAVAAAQAGVSLPGQRPTIALVDVAGGPAAISGAQIKEDGTFTMEGVAASRFNLSVNGLPADTYLKSARFGGQDVMRAPLDLTSGAGGRLDVVLSKKAASVSGAVRNDKGEAMSGVMVALWSTTPEPNSSTNGVRTASTDQSGAFKFTGLPPAEYRVAAWEDAEPGLLQNREFLALFAGNSEEIELSEGAQAGKDLKMILSADILREAAKLP